MMFLGGSRKTYTQIDGDEEEAGDAGQNSDSEEVIQGAPPTSHEIYNSVSFEGVEQNADLVNSSKGEHRWDHIEDIDQFFTLVYEYHQGNGFACIALRHAFALFQFVFVICFSAFLLQCVDYDVLFNNSNTTTTGAPVLRKRQLNDAIIPYCASSFHPIIVVAILLATVFWLAHLLRVGYRLLQLCEMRTFFATELNIQDSDLSNFAWQDVVIRLCELQPKLNLIINKEEITPLDVYQRILRYKNYFVALVYNDILPPHINVPVVGGVQYLSSGLRLNLEWLFFWGPWAPWKDAYTLKEEFRKPERLIALGDKMRQTILWMSVANLVFFPFIFLYQVLFSFFSYADLIKREPGVFGMRRYSNYGKEKLRHFNELDHELHSRLNRSYGFAVRYMDQFVSPTAEIVAKTIAFTCGSVFAILLILSAWDEDVLNIEHVLTAMTVCGAVVVVCRSFIPNENLVFCQQFLMRQIVANIHYAPKSWLNEAHSTDVYKEFSQLFQLKAQYLVEELLSPLITPFVLYFHVRPRADLFVQFFHNNTRFVDRLGDVCSYSMMDISVDGDRRLAPLNQSVIENPLNDSRKVHKRHDPCGKIELSLLNFATLNPNWVPSKVGAVFINNIKEFVAQDLAQNPLQDAQRMPLQCSLQDLETSMRNATTAGSAEMMTNRVISSVFHAKPAAQLVTGSSSDQKRGDTILEGREVQTEGEDDEECGPPSSFVAASSSATPRPGSSLNRRNEQSEASQGATTSISGGAPMTQSMVNTTSSYAQGNNNANSESFIHPYPLGALLQPRIQESRAKAMEMSVNALALNRMLMSSFSLAAGGAHQPNYQAFESRNLRNPYTPGALLHHQSTVGGSRYGAVAGSIIAASNLWGVPEVSQVISVNEMAGQHQQGRRSMYTSTAVAGRGRRRNEEEDIGKDHNDPMTP